MPNNKVKILAAFSLISLVVTVLIFAPNFSAQAENDSFVNEIAGYRTWTKITKEPIKVEFQFDGKAGDENVFVVDGREVTNFPPSTFG